VLTPSQRQALEGIAAEYGSAAQLSAWRMTCDTCRYHERLIFPTEPQERKAFKAKSLNPFELSASPNPAKDYTILSYKLPAADNRLLLQVVNIFGRIVFTQAIEQEADQITLPVAAWPAGVYMAEILSNAKVLKTAKFTVIR
jgi:hypothetical protein